MRETRGGGGGGGGGFFFQAEDGIRDYDVTGVQTCALPIYANSDEFSLDCNRSISSNRARRREGDPQKRAQHDQLSVS